MTPVENGIVEIRDEMPRHLAETASEGLFSAAQVRRLRDWLRLGRPRGAESAEAKLLLFSPDVSATRDRAQRLDVRSFSHGNTPISYQVIWIPPTPVPLDLSGPGSMVTNQNG